MSEWRDSWPVVLASFFGIALLTVHPYLTGVMIEPLEKEFGWPRAQISMGPSIVAVSGCIAAPFLGMAIDRLGARRIAIPGVIGLCAAIAMLSQAGASIWSWWALWCLVALTHPLIKPTVWVTAVSSLFAASRGFALAVALCGMSLATILTPIMTTFLVDNFGWRLACVVTAGFWLLLTLPLVLLFFFSSVDKDRTRETPDDAARDPVILPGLSPREAFLSFKFVKLAVAAVCITMCTSAVLINLVPIFSSTGIERTTAAGIAAIAGISGMTGKLIGGALIDRLSAGMVVGTACAMPAIAAILLVTNPGSVLIASLSVVVIGFATGIEIDGVGYLSSRHFGLRNLGLIYGSTVGLIALAGGVGPVLANLAYDLTGAYELVLWSVAPLSLLAALFFATLGRYPEFSSALSE